MGDHALTDNAGHDAGHCWRCSHDARLICSQPSVRFFGLER